MPCSDFFPIYLKFVNGVVLAFSLVVIGFGAFLAANLGDNLNEINLAPPVVVTIVMGVLMFIFAVIGLVAARNPDKKWLAFVYVLGCVVLSVGVLGSGIALLSYGGFLDDVRDGEVDKQVAETILDFELAIFQDCCGGTVENCADNGNTPPCFTDEKTFNKFVDFVGDNTCETLAEFEINGHKIVGEDTANGECGGGDAATFVEEITDFIKDNLTLLASVNLGLGVVLLLLLISACGLMCTGNDGQKK